MVWPMDKLYKGTFQEVDCEYSKGKYQREERPREEMLREI